jgi:KDO2-lipid IV(A) lauroyltransferase
MGYNQRLILSPTLNTMSEFVIGHPLRNVARKHPLLAKLLWQLDFALIWLLITAFRCLPVDTASRFGDRLARWLGTLMKRKSGMFRGNLQIAFPELSADEIDVVVNNAWGSAGRVLAEYPHLKTILEQEERLHIEILEPIITYGQPDKPCVMVTAHLSNWEVVCSAMARMGIPNASLYSPPLNPYLDRLLLDSRQALNCELYPRENSARLLMQALKKGRSAAMVMDRRVEKGGQTVRFFGRDKPSTLLPAKLALKFNCDLVPVQVQRLQDARFKVTFHPPIRPAQATADENEQALDMTQQIHEHFEGWIQAQPQEWFCSKRVWSRPKRYLRKKALGKKALAKASVDPYAI